MKKIIAIFLALICILVGLSSCGDEEDKVYSTDILIEFTLEGYASSPCGKIDYTTSTVKIDSNPYNYDSDNSLSTKYLSEAADSIKKINNYLGLPYYVYDDMMGTSALDGRQTYSDTYKGIDIHVSWGFHPDRGLEVTYSFS